MPAICQCQNGHTFSTQLIEEDPDTNSQVVEASECPECGDQEFSIIEIVDDYPDLEN